MRYGAENTLAQPKEKQFRKPRYTRLDRDRHGNLRWYTIDKVGRKIRMREAPGSPEFFDEWKLIRSRPIPKKKTRKTLRLEAARNAGQSPYKDPENARKKYLETDLLHLSKRARLRAQSKGVAFDLNDHDLLSMLSKQDYRCKLTGIRFEARTKVKLGETRNPKTVSIDRIRPENGYTIGNVRLVVSAINIAMLDWGERVFEEIALAYVRKRKLLED